MRIVTEDKHAIAPVLAKKLTGREPEHRPANLGELTNLETMRNHVRGAEEWVIFIVDREGGRSHERPEQIRKICATFQRLCEELRGKRPRIALVIAEPCQEAWLVEDREGLKRYALGRRQRPGDMMRSGGDPPDCDPIQQIKEIFMSTSRELGRKPKPYQKSQAPEIAKYINPGRINRGDFLYFKRFVMGEIEDGCDNEYQREQCGDC